MKSAHALPQQPHKFHMRVREERQQVYLVYDFQVVGVGAGARANHLHEVVCPPPHLIHGVLSRVGLLIALQSRRKDCQRAETAPKHVQKAQVQTQGRLQVRSDVIASAQAASRSDVAALFHVL